MTEEQIGASYITITAMALATIGLHYTIGDRWTVVIMFAIVFYAGNKMYQLAREGLK